MESISPCTHCMHTECRFHGNEAGHDNVPQLEEYQLEERQREERQREERQAVVRIVARLMWNNPHPFEEFDLLMRIHVVRAAVIGHRQAEKWHREHMPATQGSREQPT